MRRFCLASYLTLPFRPAPLEGSLIPTLEVRFVSLVSLVKISAIGEEILTVNLVMLEVWARCVPNFHGAKLFFVSLAKHIPDQPPEGSLTLTLQCRGAQAAAQTMDTMAVVQLMLRVRSCPAAHMLLTTLSALPSHPPASPLALPPQRGLAVTDRLGLLGASVTQHPEFESLLNWLMAPERSHVRLSIASVRTNTVTPQLAAALSSRCACDWLDWLRNRVAAQLNSGRAGIAGVRARSQAHCSWRLHWPASGCGSQV